MAQSTVQEAIRSVANADPAFLAQPFPDPGAANGLYLAFVRAPLLRTVLPATPADVLMSFALIVFAGGCVGASYTLKKTNLSVLCIVFFPITGSVLRYYRQNYAQISFDGYAALLWAPGLLLALATVLIVGTIRIHRHHGLFI